MEEWLTVPTNSTRAIQIPRFGPPEVLVEREIPLREPGPGEVHLRIEATGVNFADLLQRAGLYGKVPDRPFSPGFEVAGKVEGVGVGVKGWRAGDKAVALSRYGGYVRDLILPTDQTFPYPEELSPAEAAAVPVVFLTAWFALFETGFARPEDQVLVLGAGGGVGTAAVQLAVSRGLRVYGTAGTPAKRAYVVEELGAEACFDSRGDWEPEVWRALGEKRTLDIALDPVGGKATQSCLRLLGPMGRLVFYGLSEALPGRKRSWFKAALARFKTPSIHPLSLVGRNQGVFGIQLLYLKEKEILLAPAMEKIFQGIVEKKWKPIMDRTFPLTREGAIQAHHFLQNRKNLGKVVLEVPG